MTEMIETDHTVQEYLGNPADIKMNCMKCSARSNEL